MGTLYYADSAQVAIPVDDRELAHIKFVMVNKLRRGEPFTFSWDRPESEGGGRLSIWVSAQIPLVFEFESTEPSEMNREWLDLLSQSASTITGLQRIPEPAKHVG
jgi:hypothetical protein